MHVSSSVTIISHSPAPSSVPPLCVCPLVPSTIPLLAVCYSCWSNLENVPNPLSVLLPQRNTKWIRRDYHLPLPPSRPPLPRPPLLLPRLQAVTLSSSSHFPYLFTCYVHLSPDISLFIGRIKAFSLFRWQIGSNALPSDRCSRRPSASWDIKYR